MEPGRQSAAWGSWRPELGSTVRLLWPVTVEQVSQGVLKQEHQCPDISGAQAAHLLAVKRAGSRHVDGNHRSASGVEG